MAKDNKDPTMQNIPIPLSTRRYEKCMHEGIQYQYSINKMKNVSYEVMFLQISELNVEKDES